MTRLTALIACTAIAVAAPAFAQNNTTAPAAKPSLMSKLKAKMAPKPVASTKPTVAPSALPKTMAAAPATTKGPAKTEAKTPEGKACSAQADAQNLHGKARKSFREKCKDAAKAGAPKA
jgi:hypothetical protein